MGILIRIDDLLAFAPNVGILVERTAIERPEELLEALRVADQHIDDPELRDECHGSGHPAFADATAFEIDFEEYLQLIAVWREKDRIAQATRDAKRHYSRLRRAEFARARPDLVLALIARGVPYVCAVSACGDTDALHLDHVVPLSRGGSDDLSNLQFLCRLHNSQKGDR